MSKKPSRSCKFVCKEKNCQDIWFTGSKEPSRFAKKWPVTCEKCEKRQKDLISKRNEIQQAEMELHLKNVEAEKEFLEMKLSFYENALEKAPQDDEVKNEVLKIIEGLKPFTEPDLKPITEQDLKPENVSKTKQVKKNYHEQMSEAEAWLGKIKLRQKVFEANQELTFKKFKIYESTTTVNAELLKKISNLKISDTAPQNPQPTENPQPTLTQNPQPTPSQGSACV